MKNEPAGHGKVPSHHPAAHSGYFSSNLPKREFLPQFRVILLENAHLEMMFVVRAVMELIRFCRTEAVHKMWQAHYHGRAVLIVTHRERAELFVELFSQRGLKVALEAI